MTRPAANRVIACGVAAVAALLILLMIIPAEVWDEAGTDASYSGFDPQLIYVKETGPSSVPGQVQISPESLQITALGGSLPVVHLATTPLDRLGVQARFRILENPEHSVPLRVGIWSPRAGAGYFLTFSGAPDNEVVAEAVREGIGASALLGGEPAKRQVLWTYSLDRDQVLRFSMDKAAGMMKFELLSQDSPPSGHPMLRLAGGPQDPSYHDIVSDVVSVRPGETYAFGGLVRAVSGRDAYKLSLQWLDGGRKHISFANDWRGVSRLRGREWTGQRFQVEAPPAARYARLYLGAGANTRLLFSDLFLRRAGDPQNLLANGDLSAGASGWSFVGGRGAAVNIVRADAVSLVSTLTRSELPELFDSRRLTFTASASSSGLPAASVMEAYTLSLPHERFYGVKLSDARPRVALATLLGLGALLLLAQTAVAVPGWWRALRRWPAEGFSVRLTPATVWGGGAVAACLILNLALMGLGSHPFDMTAQKTWAYIAVTKRFDDLYYLPNLVPLAEVWNGGPWHEAVFPYGAVMAWIFRAVGFADRLFLNGPGGLQADGFGMEVTIKAFVLLFAVGDACLIYAILRAVRVSSRWSLIAAGVFFFSPALWISVSLWGQTHAASVFFLLFGVWRTAKGNPVGAWLGVGAAALTRPQMLVPAALLGLVLLRRYPPLKNVQGVSWTVVSLSLVLAPFTLTIGPSLPVDILYNQFYFQEAGGNEAAQTVVSLSTYSVWPLATYLLEGLHGLDRFGYPADSGFLGPLSYQRASGLATLAALAVAGGAILFDRRPRDEEGRFLVPLAFGTVAFFVLKTGLAATHALIALPFLALTVHRIRPGIWFALMAVWTVTTAVPVYGRLGLALEDVEHLAPALYAGNNPVTWLFMQIDRSDWFITTGILANLLVFGWLGYETLFRRRDAVVPGQPPVYKGTVAVEWYRGAGR